jgi:hypothetical protein
MALNGRYHKEFYVRKMFSVRMHHLWCEMLNERDVEYVSMSIYVLLHRYHANDA